MDCIKLGCSPERMTVCLKCGTFRGYRSMDCCILIKAAKMHKLQQEIVSLEELIEKDRASLLIYMLCEY